MPYKISHEEKGILFCFYGSVDLADLLSADAAMYHDKRYHEFEYFIWDGREVEFLELIKNQPELVSTVDTLKLDTKKDMKGAFVTLNKETQALAEQYIEMTGLLGSAWEMKVFQSMEEAREWVSVSLTQRSS